jgi:predicted NBD/HSP70 family sugar kinase
MSQELLRKLADLASPQVVPALDPGFRPAALANRAFRRAVSESGQAAPLAIGLERPDGTISRYDTQVFAEGDAKADLNLPYAERLVKFLLWQKGGCKVTVGGPKSVGEYVRQAYAPDTPRAFDYGFMGQTIYERPFEVVVTDADGVPAAGETSVAIGRHLEGNRIGFDLGASDRKVAAVVNGESVFSEEVVWDPRNQTDPSYHFEEIGKALRSAAEKMSSVDAIGGSSAGVIINNRPMVASLFRGVPEEAFDKVKSIFLDLAKEWGVPFQVANDGDVTALAGSMSLNDNAVLGIAMGSSEAAGYVNEQGNITGWLNELAFAPIDYNPEAAVDEWSGDSGCGAQYVTQQAVFRLARQQGISLDESLPLAGQLKQVQKLLEEGDENARQIWQTIGVYAGYAIAHYADFYAIRHLLLLGRVTSGSGGPIVIEKVKEVLAAEFPELAKQINVQLPDEKTRRVGQAVAAASLPEAK